MNVKQWITNTHYTGASDHWEKRDEMTIYPQEIVVAKKRHTDCVRHSRHQGDDMPCIRHVDILHVYCLTSELHGKFRVHIQDRL